MVSADLVAWRRVRAADEHKKGQGMTKNNILKGVASLAAVAALAAGGVAISSAANNSGSTAASSPTSPAANGQRPAGGPMMGTPATGAAADKAKAAALAKYPGTAERVLKNTAGDYVVHVFKSDGSEVHVLVSSAFKVTGVQTGGPPGGRPPGAAPSATPPATAPPGSSSSSGTSPS
jgi:hypothetical protein